MELPQFFMDALINGLHVQKALIDNGNMCFALVNERFVSQHHIPSIPISTRTIGGIFDGPCENIENVARFSVDIGGHRNRNVFAYVVPKQKENLILGRPWLKSNFAIIDEGKGELTFATSGVTVRDRSQVNSANYDHRLIGASAFSTLHRRAKH